MSAPLKVLFIGIDAGDKDLIQKWTKERYLPNLDSLLHSAAWSITQSPPGLYVGAIWPSFYTGVSPATHARYCYRQLQPGSYESKPVSPRDVKSEPFWNALDRAGKRVGIIDVPKTYPSQMSNGMHIVDWGAHDPDRDGFSVWPESFAPEVEQKFGVDTMHNCNAFRTRGEEFREFRDELIRRIKKKTELSAHFLARENWDCFMTVYSESHCVGHQCWHLHDEQHPKYDPNFNKLAGDPMKEVYKAIDEGIGELINTVDDDTYVIIFASHGIGPHYDANFMLDDILLGLEGLPLNRQGWSLDFSDSLLWKSLPQKARNIARRTNNKVRKIFGIDKNSRLARRNAFPVPNNDAYGGIRINLVGREPKGKINPGAEYDDYCRALSKDLMTFINLATEEPLVKSVLRSSDLYEGENLHYLPDLLVEWDRRSPISEITSPKTGKISGIYRKCRTGDHTSEGLALITGPSIASGQIEEKVSVMDLAPTIASCIGIELPHMEGRSLLARLEAR